MEYFLLILTIFSGIQLSLTDEDGSSEIIYNFYTADKKDEPVEIHSNDTNGLNTAGFDVNLKTVFLIYSFEEPSVIDTKCKLKDGILSQQTVNLFMVDWSPVSSGSYIVSQTEIVTIGQYLSNFLNILVDDFKLDLNEVTIIGWDLGAHIAGIAGKNLTKKISTIIGLDPSGPLFTENNKLNRLDVEDATFVHVIHTNTLINGYNGTCGTADYYPNEGIVQKSCGNDVTGVCSHERALTFFAESLTSDNFIACNDYESYKESSCEKSNQSIMGRLEVDTSAKGEYYLDTNDQSPYAKG